MTNLQKRLFELQDVGYKDFQSKLMPTVDPDSVIGIRTPILRKFAKEYAKEEEATSFMNSLPHKYYEENNLHGFMLESIKNYDKAIEEVEKFLPYINNWATCDTTSPKVFKKNRDKLIDRIKIWIKSDKVYTIRYGVGMLMAHYLDEDFNPEYLNMVSLIVSEEYYVNMMIAWYFATALAKQYDETIIYLEEKRLSKWVHNKTIQKAVESYRITDEQKIMLKTMRIK